MEHKTGLSKLRTKGKVYEEPKKHAEIIKKYFQQVFRVEGDLMEK